jgi:16S rRNA G966 N2-methylase RsmD
MFDFDLSTYPIEDTIVYIDPPYEDTMWYWTPDIDYDKFREWFNNNPYCMIASSYKARDYIYNYITIDKRKKISWNVLSKEWVFINKAFIDKHIKNNAI